jgi:hypothetical protein
LAEAGAGRVGELTRERLRALAGELDRAGLQELGGGLAELDRAGTAAAAVIRNGYLCRLHREAMSLTLGGQPAAVESG